VPASRAPWWLYTVAAMLIYSFTLHIYTIFRAPQSLGFVADYSSGSMIVTQVSSQGAVARGHGRSEFRQGDRLEAQE
jgi:hypothetical protein